jgi:hypothetical protein|tara:strand:+ start:584 stop:913 length:330 start_codon:yes stop_codon:yes gene_type:complete
MHKNKLILIIGLISLLVTITSCSSVKEAFDPQRKNGSEEFLVEKKAPLSMPPEFYELPKPQSNKNLNQNEIEDIEVLISNTAKENNQTIKTENLDKDFELLILDKIKNN